MPLYEFYCQPCHTIFTFRSPVVDTVTVPACPQCGAPLARQVSPFSHSVKGKTADSAEGNGADPDEMAFAGREDLIARMGDRLEALSADDADPAEAVRVMREMAEAGGLTFNADVREAMARIEAGEDPEAIDEQFAEVFDSHDPFVTDEQGHPTFKPGEWLRRIKPPRRDPKWYDMRG
ncbi:MAG: zinc ribbon domain-containing protein [Kiritimatiellae bacterium]|nr:zinc ribbon domain-containing protein [Kiritimatiellia bacterium]MBP5226570.1 zinc ribbon domain-containing protein [Kiritimatiellia bacterium]